MAITIKDVAKTVGVATSTVSRTLQNSPSISEKTKQNVRQVMDELGYRPNLTARGLASKTTQLYFYIFNGLKSCKLVLTSDNNL
ncbi:LacI family DNA-binding transcriptional regulator [Atopococcus tabaci]|uniref:LacI family DNA-binding transcriptional regulator n=1 Tax=Atopococcus tabaci TaxID=269774 RepID=UPI003B83863D